MRRTLRFLKALLLIALVLFAGLLAYGYARRHPEDMPWTSLDLTLPVGAFTGRKLAGLAGDGPKCRALLARAGIRFSALPPRSQSAECGYEDAVRFAPDGALAIRYRPSDLGTGCAVAAALALWDWHVVQVAEIEHFGSYSCRRLYGRAEGAWSEHARANAVDIAGFRLEDGTRITIAGDWRRDGPGARFLRDVRDGACRLFASVLSPDYNEAHRDHFHLDQRAAGERGWRACR